MNDDERNVDEQLDEAQKQADARSARPILYNNRNNTRTDADASGQTVTNDDSEGESA